MSASYLTTPEIVELLAVQPHQVLGWIRNGQLWAVNISDGSLRARLRVSREDLDAFLTSRDNHTSKPTQFNRRRQQEVRP